MVCTMPVRRWWIGVMEVMQSLGGRTLVGDESLIYFHRDGKLIGLISLHVDDFQGTGNETFFTEVMDVLCKSFKISKREIQNFRFTGVDVKGLENGNVEISQESYVEALKKIDINPEDDEKRPLNREEFKLYRGLVGKLTWLSEMTRPDLSYDTLDLAGYNKEATTANLKKINKVVDKAQKTKGVVTYSKIGDFNDLKILAISDGGLNRREERTLSVILYCCQTKKKQRWLLFYGKVKLSKQFANLPRQLKLELATRLWKMPYIWLAVFMKSTPVNEEKDRFLFRWLLTVNPCWIHLTQLDR